MFENLLLSCSITSTSSVIFAHCSLFIAHCAYPIKSDYLLNNSLREYARVCVRECFSTSFHSKGYTTIALLQAKGGVAG